jgi:urea carboxylase
MNKPFDKILIANRGAIACRITRTLKRLGIASVAIHSTADAESLHVQQADEAHELPGVTAAETYLDAERILAIARATGAQAIHPGYGFLSENTGFARACRDAGIAFIGPEPEQIEQFGLKHTARELALANGVPLVPGTGLLATLEAALDAASGIGFPVMLKSTAGGGGIGMQVCRDSAELESAWARVRRLSQNNFGNDGVFLEKYIARARHIEIQAVGDGQGLVVTLGERECSLQRRNQKVIEETPAPGLADSVRDAMATAARDLLAAVNYQSAGTVEFILDDETQAFYFLEVNTRLQVEHGVTEAVTGTDLVEWMIRIAAGDTGFLSEYRHSPSGAAIQARIYAEDAGRQFQPSSGLLTAVRLPEAIRCDHWIEAGITVPAFYDPMLAKFIAHGPDRNAAVAALDAALAQSCVEGIVTNLAWLRQVLADPAVQEGCYSTAFLNSFVAPDTAIDVLAGGTQTTLQDYPGRLGYWAIGVPPSGPMDAVALRLANHLVGNASDAAALEITLTGPTLKFRSDTVIALTGAALEASLDGIAVPSWASVPVKAGSTLTLGKLTGAGLRAVLAVAGGFQVEPYLGSRSTFTLGQFGGHGGRALRTGDVLRILPRQEAAVSAPLHQADEAVSVGRRLDPSLRPCLERHWQVAVIYGPHGAPDFFTDADMDSFFATDWEVHFNSSRTGVRLIGPKPVWARQDGGEAGLHPSNIHDNAYAIGAVDFTGDMPVILGPDGPSLGGFVCPVAIIKADLWKMGQFRPGDTIRFYPVTLDEAETREREQEASLAEGGFINAPRHATPPATAWREHSPILARREARGEAPAVVYRVAGDDNILVEYGELELDLVLRFRVHALMTWLEQRSLAGIIDITPGIRSLQVHFDNLRLGRDLLLGMLLAAEDELGSLRGMSVPSRVVHLPLSWDDPGTRLAIEKYMTTVRPDAPWCPSNIEFIRRINGLDSIEAVRRTVFEASYLVMGLGDVYLGAPVATPLDPRHRLVTTKYNPARTWTPENAVGIGGAYLCVYGMEGPGGYQFVGRTVQMWNRYRKTAAFSERWLLRFFDQIRFHEVDHDTLLEMRRQFPLGRADIRIEESRFSLDDYLAFLQENAAGIEAFRTLQRTAFAQERSRWSESEAQMQVAEAIPTGDDAPLADGQQAIESPVTGSLWQLCVKPGDTVRSGDTLAILESMKMEFPVTSPADGRVVLLTIREGQGVAAGQRVVILEAS